MAKSADAFRTISEVAEWLETPAHVLRFWESKFTPVKPVKRAGGRRYYRPQDMRLLGGIKKLLHDDGMSIKSVQKLLREEGIKHVAALSQPLPGEDAAIPPDTPPPAGSEDRASAQVLDFPEGATAAVAETRGPEPEPEPEEPQEAAPQTGTETAPQPAPEPEPEPQAEETPQPELPMENDAAEDKRGTGDAAAPPAEADAPVPDTPDLHKTPLADDAAPQEEPTREDAVEAEPAAETPVPGEAAPVPDAAEPADTAEPSEAVASGDEATIPPAPAVAPVEVPPDPADTIEAAPGVLTDLTRLPRPLPPRTREALAPFVARLRHRLDEMRDG